jgi:hypothetical protein
MPLYRRLASETARQLNYPYPYEMDQAISEFILDNSPVDTGQGASTDAN